MAESPSGGLKLHVVLHDFDDDVELDQFGPEVHIVLSRRGCLRLAETFGRAGQAEPGSLGPGSPGAMGFTKELNDLLVRDGNALFWDCAVDDSVGVPVGPPSRIVQVAREAGGCLGPALIIGLLGLVARGAFALWRDLVGR